MSIIKKITFLLFCSTLILNTNGFTQEVKKIGKYKDWETIIFIDGKNKVCFAQSVSVLQAPKKNQRDARLFVSFRPNDKISDEIELANWYRSERFPRLSVTRGMIRGRKLLSIAGWAKHGVLWEFLEMDDNEYSFEHRFIEADRGEDWRGRHVLEYVTHAPGSPHAGRRIWPK